MKKIITLMLLYILSFGIGRAQLIKNGNLNNTSYWTSGNAEFTNFNFDGADPSGNRYFDVTPNGGSGNSAYIEQKIQIDTACKYFLRFKIRPSNDGNKTAGFDIYDGTQKLNTSPILSSDATKWVLKVSDEFELSAGSHTIRITGNNGLTATPRVMGLDDIELVKSGNCAPCHCGDWRGFAYSFKSLDSKEIILPTTDRAAPKFISCNQTVVVKTTTSLLLNPAFTCSGTCAPSYMGILKAPNGTTKPLSSFPYSFNAQTPGYYTLTVTPQCGNTVCQPCTIRIFVTPGCNGDIFSEKF